MNKVFKKLLFSLFMIISIHSIGQEDQTIMTLFGRICQTDSIKSYLLQTKEGTDSIVVFNFKTPNINDFGIAEYEFKDFFINFDTGSNFLFQGTPYGDIEVLDISNKKALIVISIQGMGNRKEQGKFEKASYSFINKKYRWMLKDVKYQ